MFDPRHRRRLRRAAKAMLSWPSPPAYRRAAIATAESLEGRLFLSAVTAGPEFLVNSTTAGNQQWPSVASDADGDFVVAWYGPDSAGPTDIFAQRYNAAGEPQGGEFRVNAASSDWENRPSVAMDADGDFVVAWVRVSGATAGSPSAVYARRFDSVGQALGPEFQVAASPRPSAGPAVATDADGDFVISWTSTVPNVNGPSVYARRYDAAGVAQGDLFRVNARTASSLPDPPSIAMEPDGDFAVTWAAKLAGGTSYDIYAQRFDRAGQRRGDEFRVNTTAAPRHWQPATAAVGGSGFVAAWMGNVPDLSGNGVYAQRFDAAGQPQGDELVVVPPTGYAGYPAIAASPDGRFMVLWYDGRDVYARRFTAAGQADGSAFRVNADTSQLHGQAAAATDWAGHTVVAWESQVQDGSGTGIYARRYVEDSDTTGPLVAGVTIAGTPVRPGGWVSRVVPEATASFSENLSTAGGTSGADSVTNPANWGLTFNGQDAASRISSVAFGLNSATNKYEATVSFSPALVEGDYVLTVRQSVRDVAGNALDGDTDGRPGGDFVLPFGVQQTARLGATFRVNTYTADAQRFPAVAADAAGDFVVAWTSSGQDGDGYGVYAQRYGAGGVSQGGELRVNSYTTRSQLFPAVAMDSDGDFVVVWQSDGQDGSEWGIYAQRYNAAGAPQGGEFRVNSYTPGSQSDPDVAMDSAGNFVVTWAGIPKNGSNGLAVYAQRYDAAGVRLGGEFQVTDAPGAYGNLPAVAMSADGAFVVAWQSGDAQYSGVFARRYGADGQPFGGAIQVNTYTAESQQNSDVAADAAGDFVVSWESVAQDGSGYGIYAQRYDAAGVPRGEEFRVNTFTPFSQFAPSVAMGPAGDFVVTWYNVGQDSPSQWGAFALRYSALGQPRGGEFKVNVPDSAFVPAATMDAHGRFVIAWETYGQDGSGPGIYAQRFGPNEPPTPLGIKPVDVAQYGPPAVIDLAARFADSTDSPAAMTYSVVGDTEPGLFNSTVVDAAGKLTLDLAPRRAGTATLTVRATDSGGLWADETFEVTVNPAPPPWLVVPTGGQWGLSGPDAAPTLTLAYGAFSLDADPAAAAGAANLPNLTISLSGGASLAVNASAHLAALTLIGASTATLAGAGPTRTTANHRILVLGSSTEAGVLSIDNTSGGRLDLADGDLVLKGGGAAGLAAVQLLLGSGYNKHAWNGGGIVTSTAAGKTSNALGYALNDGSVIKAKTTFGPNNEPVGPADVLVKYTYEGDSNLDGQVSFDDYFYIDSKYPKLSGSTWVTGDFDYNAQTSFDDYFYIDSTYPRNSVL